MRASARPLVGLLAIVPTWSAAQSVGRLPRLEGGGPPAPPPVAPPAPTTGGGSGVPSLVGVPPGPRGWDSATPGSVGHGGKLHEPRARPQVIVVGFPLWYAGYGYAGYGFGLSATWDAGWGGTWPVAATAAPAAPPRAPRSLLIEVGPGAGTPAGALQAAPLAGGLLRVAWTGEDAAVREVTLVVADVARRVLAEQTVRAAPWRAVFDVEARVAFVGVTLVRADGVSTTTLVPRAAAGAP